MIVRTRDLTQDKLACVDALMSAVKSGDPPSFPPPKWSAPGLSSMAPSLPAARAASAVPPTPAMRNTLPANLPPLATIVHADAHPEYERLDELDDNYNDEEPVNVDVELEPEASNSDDEYWGQLDEPDEPDDMAKLIAPPLPQSHANDEPPPVIRISETTKIDLTKKPYYSDVAANLRNVFNLNSFRKNQLEAICASMEGHDVFVLMPTGGGKSLCFQLPAVINNRRKDSVTVVISPLLALMHDQVYGLESKGVSVAWFVGDQTPEEQEEMYRKLNTAGRRPSLLYITPEKLKDSPRLKDQLGRLYRAKLLERVVADEAHCIIEMGRSFREAVSIVFLLNTTSIHIRILAVRRVRLGSQDVP